MAAAQVPLWLVLISSLLSGLLGVLVSTFYYHRYEKRKVKFDTLRRLAATCYALTGRGTEASKADFFAALNEAHIVYYDAPTVLERLAVMHNELRQPGRLDDNIVELFRAIFDHLGIKREALKDSFILRPFTPGKALHSRDTQPAAPTDR